LGFDSGIAIESIRLLMQNIQSVMQVTSGIMLFQGDIAGFSVPVVFCRKARGAGNGDSLVKLRNTAAGHHRGARRVGLSASMAVLQLLQRE
jgi:hypothetical protein